MIVIQDHSLNPGSSEENRSAAMDPGVKFFTDEATAMGAVPLLYQTWGRRDGFSSQGADFYEMNERVRMGYRAAAARAGGVAIVPVGDAWEREYRAGRGIELYHEDGSHPSSLWAIKSRLRNFTGLSSGRSEFHETKKRTTR